MNGKTIRFFRLNGEWFADVEGHALEDNQMVAGADVFLEEVDKKLSGRGEVFITVTDRLAISGKDAEPYLAKFVMRKHDEFGADYILTGPLARQYGAEGFPIWICNVTHDVLGEHPKSIYVTNIQ